jgi:hypothetical protein
MLVSSSPSGWTNNKIGLAWLEQVFDRCTKSKARRKYRLLILDGHGSHLTMDFINYCLREVFKTHKKHKNKSKALEFKPHRDYHDGAEFYAPSRVEKARSDKRTKQQNQRAEELRKAEIAKLRHANKQYNEKIAQERREQRVREKAKRDRVRAEKAEEAAEHRAEKERQKQVRDAEKAI